MEQRAKPIKLWAEPFVPLRIPKIFDLRRDPFERAQHDSNTYYEWMEGVVQWAGMPATALTGAMIASFKDYPPRQRPATFNLDEVMQSLTAGGEGK